MFVSQLKGGETVTYYFKHRRWKQIALNLFLVNVGACYKNQGIRGEEAQDGKQDSDHKKKDMKREKRKRNEKRIEEKEMKRRKQK